MKKDSKKKWLIISLVIIAIVIIFLIILGLSKGDNEVKEDAKWLQAYVARMACKDNNSHMAEYPNKEFQMVKFHVSDIPALVYRYDMEDREGKIGKVFGLYLTDENGEAIFDFFSSGDCSLKDMYNKEKDRYEWFLYRNVTGDRVYEVLEHHITNFINEKENENYDRTKDELKETYWFFDKANSSYSNNQTQKDLDSKYIDTKLDDLANNWIPYEYTQDEEALKAMIIEDVNKNKAADTIVSEEQKAAIQATVKQQSTTKTETNTSTSSQTNTQPLKVGKYTLKYGKYVADVSGGYSSVITLKEDGKFHIKANYSEVSDNLYTGETMDCEGTYIIELNQPTGSPNDYSDFITFKTDKGNFSFEVIKNDAFSDQWHGYSYSQN